MDGRQRQVATGAGEPHGRRSGMAIVTLGDLLDRAAEFERRVENYYAAIRDTSKDNGVRLLTYYLARHRRHQEEGFEGLDDSQKARIRAIDLKYDVSFDPERTFHLLNCPPEQITGEELLDAAAGYDAQLIELYKSILQQPLIDEARSVMEALIRVEERDIVMLKKMSAMHYF
jgi:hypothetical protein